MSLTETTVRNDVFLTVVSSTPGKDEDDLLQPSSSSENTDNDDGISSMEEVALLLMALGDENVQVEEVVLGNGDVQLDVANTEVEATEGNITTSTSNPWDIDVESIFGLPMPSSEKKEKKLKKSSSLTSHRILTSEEVIREKKMKEAEREKLNFEKEKRKQIRQLKRESRVDIVTK